MDKPSREMLAEFFLESEVFKGIDIKAAVDEFFNKIYDTDDQNLVWLVVNVEEGKSSILGAFREFKYAEKLESFFPNSYITDVEIDSYFDEMKRGCELFDVTFSREGDLISVKPSGMNIAYKEDNDKEFTYSVFGIDEAEARNTALKLMEQYKYFEDHAEDGLENITWSNNWNEFKQKNDGRDEDQGEEWKKLL